MSLRYDLNFAAYGVPGLLLSTRYIKADEADPATLVGKGEEWERDLDIKYIVQQGPLKNLQFQWRNASYRSNFSRNADENRFIVSYSLPLF